MKDMAKRILRKCILYSLSFFVYLVFVAFGFLVVQELQPDLLMSYTFSTAILVTVFTLYKLRWVLFPDLCKILTVSKSMWDKLWDRGMEAICKKTK